MKLQNLIAYTNSYPVGVQPDSNAYTSEMNRLYEGEMADRIPFEELTARISEVASSEGREYIMPLKGFDPEEQLRREALSRRCRKLMTFCAANDVYGPLKASDKGVGRTAHDVLGDISGTPEAAAFNQRAKELLAAEPQDPKAILELYLASYRKLDEWNTMDFITKELSDEQLVDRQVQFEMAMQRILSVQNTRSVFLNKAALDMNDPETKAMKDELDEILERYDRLGTAFNVQYQRYDLIENPYYSLIDIKDKGFITLSYVNNQNSSLLNLDELSGKGPERDGGVFKRFVAAAEGCRINQIDLELDSAVQLLTERGVKKEDISIRNLSEGEEPVSLFEKGRTIGDFAFALRLPDKTDIELFDRNDPTKRIILTNDNLDRTHRMLMDAPKEGLTPPERPSFFMRLMHWISNNNYREEFDEYARKMSEYENETAKLEQIRSSSDGKRSIDRAIASPEPRKAEALDREQQTRHATVEREAILNYLNELDDKVPNLPSSPQRQFINQLREIACDHPDSPDPVRKLFFGMIGENSPKLDQIMETFTRSTRLRDLAQKSIELSKTAAPKQTVMQDQQPTQEMQAAGNSINRS